MQEPLIRAVPDPNQRVDRNVPSIVRSRGGWYPRWWILSAFFCSLVIMFGSLTWYLSPCSTPGNFNFLCYFATWHPLWQVLFTWLIFLIFWAIALLLGIGAIEVPRRERSRFAVFFRSVSEFGPLHPLLLFYGFFALCGLIAMWYMGRTTPLAFATTSIVVFVANCSFFQRRSGREQRFYLILYGILGLAGIGLSIMYRRFAPSETPFFLVEGLLVCVGVWAIFWRPRPPRQLPAQELLEESIALTTSPLYLLCSIWPFNRFFPNRPVGNIQPPPDPNVP
jgi:hypothetical protein